MSHLATKTHQASPSSPDQSSASKQDRRSGKEWSNIITAWKKSGLSRKAYSQEHNINYHTLSYHYRLTLKKTSKSQNKLAPISVINNPEPQVMHSASYTLALPGGSTLAIPQDYNANSLKPLLVILGVC